jgi:hypothetical protein
MPPRSAALLLILLPACSIAAQLGVLTAPAVGQVLAQERKGRAQKPAQAATSALAQDGKPSRATDPCDIPRNVATRRTRKGCPRLDAAAHENRPGADAQPAKRVPAE